MNNLHPLEQLEILNREISNVNLTHPIIVVGGQAVAYWIWKYQNMFKHDVLSDKRLFSYDIDYTCFVDDIHLLSKAWNIPYYLNKNGQPPSIGILLTKDKNGKIKQYDNKYFYNENIKDANIIDIIDSPAGFDKKYLYNNINMLCEPYFRNNQNIVILNPIACLRARLFNIYGNVKRSSINLEIERIRSLNVTILCFLVNKISSVDSKLVFKYFNLFKETILNSQVSKIDAKYDLYLRSVLNYFIRHKASFINKDNEDFFNKFLPYSLNSYDKLRSHKINVLSKQNK